MTMSDPITTADTMRSLRFHAYGDPAEVLSLEEAPIPSPGAGSVRVRVAACGLNPADWALCRGLFAQNLPAGIGLDVSGVVDAVGPANYAGYGSAGASDYAILDHWAPVLPGLDMIHAASLTMAIETAFRCIDWLGVAEGQTLVVNGAGTVIGFAAVQIGLMRGASVIATAGETFAERLRALGAKVTGYGEGMVARVREIAGGPADLVFDSAPVNVKPDIAPAGGVMPELVEIAGGDPRRVLTCVDFAGAAAVGARSGMEETPGGPGGGMLRYDVLGEFAKLAAEGRFSVPIARTFALEDWREALEISLSARAHGKLVLLLAD
jgi:NADPH:quinone reductase-like Zn-dependent oxidoreductase